MVLTLFGEIGRDMSQWPTAGHFASRLGLCPDNDITGRKVRWKGMRKVKSRAGILFRLAAHSLHREESALGDYLPHKIAVIFCTMVKKQVEYDPTIWGNGTLHESNGWRRNWSGRRVKWATNWCGWKKNPPRRPLNPNGEREGFLKRKEAHFPRARDKTDVFRSRSGGGNETACRSHVRGSCIRRRILSPLY